MHDWSYLDVLLSRVSVLVDVAEADIRIPK